MSWEAIGAIGEVASALAVVITLIYLAGQLRQNTRALRSAGYEHWNTITSSYFDFQAQYATELSEIEKADSFADLTAQQQKIYISNFNRACYLAETTFLLMREGNIPEDVHDARAKAFIWFLRLSPLHYATFQETKSTRINEFNTYIEKMFTTSGT